MALTERTPQEIIARVNQVKSEDVFGFESSDLLDFLPFDQATPFLKDGITAEEWARRATKRPHAEIFDYLPFAWGKANNQRGLSANRSISHMKAWLWLAGYTQAADAIVDEYQYYGKPCLVIVSEIVGFDWQSHDDGIWSNDEGEDGISDSDREELVAKMKQKASELADHLKAA